LRSGHALVVGARAREGAHRDRDGLTTHSQREDFFRPNHSSPKLLLPGPCFFGDEPTEVDAIVFACNNRADADRVADPLLPIGQSHATSLLQHQASPAPAFSFQTGRRSRRGPPWISTHDADS